VVRVTQQLVLSEPLDVPIMTGVGGWEAEQLVVATLKLLGIKHGTIDLVGTTSCSYVRVNPVQDEG